MVRLAILGGASRSLLVRSNVCSGYEVFPRDAGSQVSGQFRLFPHDRRKVHAVADRRLDLDEALALIALRPKGSA